MDGASIIAVLMALILSLVLTLGVTAAIYIIGALGVKKLADRRNMKNSWLAWLPVGQEYLLGKMSDDISAEEPPFKKHGWMIWYPVIAGAYLLFSFIDLIVQLLSLPDIMRVAMYASSPEALLALLDNSGAGVFSVATSGLVSLASLALTVVGAILMYRIYKRYSPGAAIAFTVCGALFGLHWLFIFIIRKKLPMYAHYPQEGYGAPVYNGIPPQNGQK